MVSCVRGGLQHAVNLYHAAQAKGDLSALPLATGVGYQENMQAADIKAGFLSKPLVIDKHMSLLDTASCQTFTEIIVTNKAEPYVAGVRMRLDVSQLPKPFQLNALASRDWNFGSEWHRWSVTP